VIRMKGDHHARTPSSFALADRLPVPEAIQPPSLAVAVGAYVKSVQQMLGPRLRSGCTQRGVDVALSAPGCAKRPAAKRGHAERARLSEQGP
jgi:hypothetical protein